MIAKETKRAKAYADHYATFILTINGKTQSRSITEQEFKDTFGALLRAHFDDAVMELTENKQ